MGGPGNRWDCAGVRLRDAVLMASIDLTPRLRLAGEYIAAHGWTQNTMQDEKGQVCLTGAVRNCAPQDGDEHIVRAVLQCRNRAESWNDSIARTEAEVIEYLATAHITDADLAGTFGPQWAEIVALVRAAAMLAPEQVNGLFAARTAAGTAARTAARTAAWAAAWTAAGTAAGTAAWTAAGTAAGTAAWDAAQALVVRHLIGQYGFTQEHYDTLTGPWRKTIGRIHADDADLA